MPVSGRAPGRAACGRDAAREDWKRGGKGERCDYGSGGEQYACATGDDDHDDEQREKGMRWRLQTDGGRTKRRLSRE